MITPPAEFTEDDVEQILEDEGPPHDFPVVSCVKYFGLFLGRGRMCLEGTREIRSLGLSQTKRLAIFNQNAFSCLALTMQFHAPPREVFQ